MCLCVSVRVSFFPPLLFFSLSLFSCIGSIIISFDWSILARFRERIRKRFWLTKKKEKRDAWKIKTTLNHTQATNAAFWRWIYIGSVHRIGPSAAMQYTHAIVWTETNIFFATQIHLFLVSSDIYSLYMCYIYRFCLSVSSYRLLISRRSNERSKSRIQQLNSQKITSCSMPRAWSTLPFDQQFFFCLSPSHLNILQVLFIVFFYIYLAFFKLRTFFF